MPTVIGILGAAGIAPAALLRPARRRDDVVVAAVASRRGARGYADRFAIERAYDSYEELLADPDLDLVYNALPPRSTPLVDRGPGGGPPRAVREAVRDERRRGASRWSTRRIGPGSGSSRRSTTTTTR